VLLTTENDRSAGKECIGTVELLREGHEKNSKKTACQKVEYYCAKNRGMEAPERFPSHDRERLPVQ